MLSRRWLFFFFHLYLRRVCKTILQYIDEQHVWFVFFRIRYTTAFTRKTLSICNVFFLYIMINWSTFEILSQANKKWFSIHIYHNSGIYIYIYIYIYTFVYT